MKLSDKKGGCETTFEVIDKAVDSLVSEGVTAPGGIPTVYALVFETKSGPNGTIPLHLTLLAI
ncbi:TPA: hypothetical protein ACQ301_002555 [Yersinia enterocolitica]